MREEHGAFEKNDDILKHCAGELIEAVEAKNMYKNTKDIEEKVDLCSIYADELMDIMYCVLVACKQDDIDVEKSLMNNIDKNKKRALCIGDKKGQF